MYNCLYNFFNAESNGGIFQYPYCAIRHYKYKDKRTASDLSTEYVLRVICHEQVLRAICPFVNNTISLDFERP